MTLKRILRSFKIIWLGLSFTIVVPTFNLVNDFQRLVKEVRCKKKTHFENTFAIFICVSRNKRTSSIIWLGVDGYYGISKKVMLHYGPGKSKEKFDEFRDNYFDINNQAGYLWHELIARNNKKQLITPYLSFIVKDFFYSKTWEELNKPFQKHHVVNAFEEFKKFKFKKHINLQLGGVDKLFEKLIDDKFINFKFRKRVMDICRDWANMSDDIGVLQ